MNAPKFVVGIDLGTTHCAVASASLERPEVRLLQIPQLVAAGEVSKRPLLPAFTYLQAPNEFPATETTLPWGNGQPITGELARRAGAKAPNRLVASAKSWICHGGVNRRAPILPWGTPDSEPHISPFEAQVSYLSHLEKAWRQQHQTAPLAAQDVVLTVPASFDEGAKSLTTEAAQQAGLGQVRLLEEPQAALYDYLGNSEELSTELAEAKLILVVDIGGGTTDFTLLRVVTDATTSSPRIERIAVGGHLMLGGDNMDAALAMYALDQAGIPRPEDATVWTGLVQSARSAKERLLAADAPTEAVISYQRRGSRLVGSTRSLVLQKQDVLRVLLDGFFPMTSGEEAATSAGRAGLTTLGLPYTRDTAVPRHVVAFLRRHASTAAAAGAQVTAGLPKPDRLLLNGGVFNAPAIVGRLLDVLASWYGDGAVRLLEHVSLDTSVARGAARFALARRGLGRVIRGGTAKAHYVGISRGGRPHALCLAPKHAEDGATFINRDRIFELTLNEPVEFPLYAYSGDRKDEPGTLLDVAEPTDLEPLPPLTSVLRLSNESAKGTPNTKRTVSVMIESALDGLGALHLSLATVSLPKTRWRLDFVLPEAKNSPTSSGVSAKKETTAEPDAPEHPKLAAAQKKIRSALSSTDEMQVKALRNDLESLLGQRGTWSGATCRGLFDECLKQTSSRELSAVHELNWLRMCGWTLRPGFGVKGDNTRLDALWELRAAGPVATTKANWGEWWILWRRIAAGLSATRQQSLYDEIANGLWPKKGQTDKARQGVVEMMRLLAALERLPPEAKRRAGELFLARIKKLGSFWPLGRVGARVLFHGEDKDVVEASHAEQWLTTLLGLDWSQAEGADFAAASIARRTGDAREVSAKLREEVLARLEQVNAKPSWTDLLRRVESLAESDVKRVLGDSLPPGLSLD